MSYAMTHLGLLADAATQVGSGVPPAVPLEPGWLLASEHVAAPRHTSQLVRLVQNARRRGMPILIVGRDRALTPELDGVVTVDLSSWQHVEPPNRERLSITVEPGASFRQILAKTLPLGLAPRALPLDLDASLGGLLSGVGVGSTSHRHGTLASQVAYAQVVLGTGEVVHTGPATERDVFDCVFGGAGRFGVITSVELRLEAAPPRVLSYLLGYADCRGLVRDLIELGNHPRALQLLAGRSSLWQIQDRTALSLEAPYCLEVTLAAPLGAEPSLPEGLVAIGAQRSVSRDVGDLVHAQHALASPAAVGGARWVALLPEAPALPLVLEHLLETMEPVHACVVTGLTQGHDTPTALASPGTKHALAVSGWLRRPSAAGDEGRLVEMQQRVYRAGGRLCPSGWLPRRDAAFWRTHYRGAYSRMVLLKRLFDPANILSSMAGSLRPAL